MPKWSPLSPRRSKRRPERRDKEAYREEDRIPLCASCVRQSSLWRKSRADVVSLSYACDFLHIVLYTFHDEQNLLWEKRTSHDEQILTKPSVGDLSPSCCIKENCRSSHRVHKYFYQCVLFWTKFAGKKRYFWSWIVQGDKNMDTTVCEVEWMCLTLSS